MTYPIGNLTQLPPPLMTIYIGTTTMSFEAVMQTPVTLGVRLTIPSEIPEGGELRLLWHEDDHVRRERRIGWVRQA